MAVEVEAVGGKVVMKLLWLLVFVLLLLLLLLLFHLVEYQYLS